MKKTVAVLLCFAMLLPMFGCTEREPNLFMDIEEIAEKYPGVEWQSGTNEDVRFVMDLSVTTSLGWMRHLTKTRSAEIVFKRLAPGAVVTLPDLSHCKKLESLQLSGELVYYRSWHEKIEVYDPESLDLTPLASSESLHLLQFGLTPNTKYTKSYPKWDLSPLKDSNVDTLVFGSDLSIKMLESIEGAENIRHLQLSRTDLMKNIGFIGSFPNLETVAVIAKYDGVDTWISNKHAIEYIAGEYDKNTADVLHAFADRGGKVVAIKSTNNYYDWYYKNVK